MQQYPKVSIGLITYNHEKFIAECIESTLAQTYPNFEIIIADDCSTDRTYEIAVEYAKKYPDIIKQVLRPTHNLGMAKNANQLLSALKADYVALFAGDDIMHPQKIEKQMALLLANSDASFCYTNLEWFNSDTGKKICSHYGMLQQPSDKLTDIIADNCVSTNTMLIRRSCVPEGGFDESLPYMHDLAFVVDLCVKGKPVYSKELLGRYRRHSNNITATHFFMQDRFELLKRFKNRFPQPEYVKPLRQFEAIAYYALIREHIDSGNLKQAAKLLPKIFPYCFSSVKWLARVGLMLKSFLKMKK